jgi:hypothetical protein
MSHRHSNALLLLIFLMLAACDAIACHFLLSASNLFDQAALSHDLRLFRAKRAEEAFGSRAVGA